MRAHAKIGKHTPRRPRVKSVALVFSLIAGAFFMALSLASPDHAWLGWLTLLPLFLSIRVQRPFHAMLSGALWGCCFFVFGTTFFDTGVSADVESLALLTGVPAIYAFLGALLTRWVGFSPFVLGVSWMGVELALSALGLHEGLLAGTQGDGTLVHWLGGALGYVLVAFTVAFINAVLVAALGAACETFGATQYNPGPSQHRKILLPQTIACIPLCHVSISRPRAPPLYAALSV